jgi:metal-sulfur cluster biosynthetic enzyme
MPEPDEIIASLREVMDPELDCNIVDLGLVYGVEVEDRHVVVTMTLTTPGCPMNDCISSGVEQTVGALEGVASAKARIVWEPPWTPDRMTSSARERVGLTARTGTSTPAIL